MHDLQPTLHGPRKIRADPENVIERLRVGPGSGVGIKDIMAEGGDALGLFLRRSDKVINRFDF
jgi:hypothetical protein